MCLTDLSQNIGREPWLELKNYQRGVPVSFGWYILELPKALSVYMHEFIFLELLLYNITTILNRFKDSENIYKQVLTD